MTCDDLRAREQLTSRSGISHKRSRRVWSKAYFGGVYDLKGARVAAEVKVRDVEGVLLVAGALLCNLESLVVKEEGAASVEQTRSPAYQHRSQRQHKSSPLLL
jgi:hypothetical protein